MELPVLASTRRVAIVGTGTIGSGWAALFAARGYAVTAFVRSEASAIKFEGFLRVAWRKLIARGLASDPEGWKSVQTTADLAECVANADYVQESVVEEISLKQDILAQIDEHAPAHVLVGSSTSFITLSLCRARARQHPERIAIVHPTLPQWDDFVEVIGSCAEHTAWLAALFGRDGLGMDAITMRKESYGHVHNCCLANLLDTAVGMIKAGITSPADVDRALVHMARLIISSNGLGGAMVGMVGNGDEEATIALSTDIAVGAPFIKSTAIASRLLPSWMLLAWVSVVSPFLRVYTASRTVKRVFGAVVRWAMAEMLDAWRAGPSNEEFEAGALRRMNKLVRVA